MVWKDWNEVVFFYDKVLVYLLDDVLVVLNWVVVLVEMGNVLGVIDVFEGCFVVGVFE